MGGGQSAQCNLGTFGTGIGIPVDYNGTTQNLGGSSICQTNLQECANQCQAMGCGQSGERWGDCCKMCERSCCQDGPAFNPNSPICQQISYTAHVQLPDDYCTNPTSRREYDEECPTGCLGAQSSAASRTMDMPLLMKLKFLNRDKYLLLAVVALFLYLLFLFIRRQQGRR